MFVEHKEINKYLMKYLKIMLILSLLAGGVNNIEAKTKIKRGKYVHKCPKKKKIINAKYF